MRDAMRGVLLSGLLAVATLAGGCSGGNDKEAPITTGSVLGPSGASTLSPIGAAAVNPGDPMSRSSQVAFTSARATKCGFLFDPQKLRTSLIVSETANGATPDMVLKVTKNYDTLVQKSTAALLAQDDYCSTETVGGIRVDLNRHLAGDFTPAVRKQAKAEAGFWDFLDNGQKSQIKPMDREAILFPSGRPQ